MKCLRLLIVCFVIVTATLYGNGQSDQERNIGDLICGPKCVQKILRLYDKEDEDIIRLVREIQWPEIRKGSTLANVAQALEKRGIHTFAMQIKPSARIVWDYPVIVHLNPKPGEEIGHFVVWLPESEGEFVRIWDTNKGVQQKNERTWSKEMSGAVLLTSLEPINDPGRALIWGGLPFYDHRDMILAWIIFLIGLGLTIDSFLFQKLFRKGEKL